MQGLTQTPRMFQTSPGGASTGKNHPSGLFPEEPVWLSMASTTKFGWVLDPTDRSQTEVRLRPVTVNHGTVPPVLLWWWAQHLLGSLEAQGPSYFPVSQARVSILPYRSWAPQARQPCPSGWGWPQGSLCSLKDLNEECPAQLLLEDSCHCDGLLGL